MKKLLMVTMLLLFTSCIPVGDTGFKKIRIPQEKVASTSTGPSIPTETFPKGQIAPTYTKSSYQSSTITPTQEHNFDNFLKPNFQTELLITYGQERFLDCSLDNRNKVLLKSSSKEPIAVLLASEDADYNSATFSEDGKRIAYILSKPSDWYGSYSESITGTDSLWVMDKNGNNKQQIGDSLQSMILRWGDGCAQVNHIDGKPSWSPDNKHIVITYWKYIGDVEFEQLYYLVDINSRTMQLLINQKGVYQPSWSEDGQYVLIPGEEGIFVFDVSNISHPETIKYPISEKIQQASIINSVSCFRNGQTNNCENFFFDFSKGLSHSVWSLRIVDSQWRKILDPSFDEIQEPVIIGDNIVGCDQGDINSISLTNRKVAKIVKLPGRLKCKTVTGLAHNGETDVVVWGKSDANSTEEDELIFLIYRLDQNLSLDTTVNVNLKNYIFDDPEMLSYSFYSGN